MARIENAILWQSTRTGLWFCEVYDRQGFKAIGLGQTKAQAQERALNISGWSNASPRLSILSPRMGR